MSDSQSINLIDLSLEEDLVDKPLAIQPSEMEMATPAAALKRSKSVEFVSNANFISTSNGKWYSLENNPFDCAENLANHQDWQDDPFDLVEREARIKAQYSFAAPRVEVQLGQLLTLSPENLTATAMPSRLSNAFNEDLLSAESPLKFVDDDEFRTEEPPPPFLSEAQKNFENDLDMLRIPMLNEIPSPPTKKFQRYIDKELLESLNNIDTYFKALADLEAIKETSKAEDIETCNRYHQQLYSLVCDLKALFNSGDTVNNDMKMQASTILESLSSTLCAAPAEDDRPSQQHSKLNVPQPFERQSTFVIEEQEDEDLSKQPFPMSNCMVSPSGTYVTDAANKRHDIELPEINPPPCSSEQPQLSKMQGQSQISDVIQQLSKLLINNNNSGGKVRETAQSPKPSSHNNNAYVKENSETAVKSSKNHETGDCDSSKSRLKVRRRSQSLTSHEKRKDSLKASPLFKRLQKPNSLAVNVSSQVATPVPSDVHVTEVATPVPSDVHVTEFKKPAQMISRRSIYTKNLGLNKGLKKNDASSDGKTASHSSKIKTLATSHHEKQQYQQQKSIVRPMNLPSNIKMFKPDVKRKTISPNKSIMKSSGPMKATIPVRKTAPIMNTSLPSATVQNLSLNLGNHSLHRASKIPKTPAMTTKKPAKVPNACSTASSGLTSPMRRRLSYGMSVTPTTRSPKKTTSVATSNLKRRLTSSDFKVKSPLRAKVTSAGLSAAATLPLPSTSSRIPAASIRFSTPAGSKLPTKAPPTKSTANTPAAKRPVNSTRGDTFCLSGVGITLTRNEENKHP